MPWRDDAHKVVVLITDSPPHAIGEKDDGFPKAYLTVRMMSSQKGINLYWHLRAGPSEAFKRYGPKGGCARRSPFTLSMLALLKHSSARNNL